MKWGTPRRFRPDDTFWLVTDPTPASTPSGIWTETSPKALDQQFKGGLTMARHPTLFTDKAEAEVEAYGRLVAMRAAQAIARWVAEGKSLQDAQRIVLHSENGQVLFEASLA